MNITLPYIDEKSGSGARAAREGSAFIISCVSDAPFTNYHVNRGDARFIGSMDSESTRVASFPISFWKNWWGWKVMRRNIGWIMRAWKCHDGGKLFFFFFFRRSPNQSPVDNNDWSNERRKRENGCIKVEELIRGLIRCIFIFLKKIFNCQFRSSLWISILENSLIRLFSIWNENI